MVDFAEKIKHKHPHFKDKNNIAKRTFDQVKENVILGKLAEIAVHKYLSQYTKDISDIDFNLYAVGETDDYDIMCNQKTISIKASKPRSSVLMIEAEKFLLGEGESIVTIDRKAPTNLFIFVRVETEGTPYAEIVGGLSCNDFWDTKRFIPRGFIMNGRNAFDYLFLKKPISQMRNIKGVPLLADNYGVHVNSLKDIRKILNI